MNKVCNSKGKGGYRNQGSCFKLHLTVSQVQRKKGCPAESAIRERQAETTWKTVWNFLKKLKMGLLFDQAVLLLGIHPKNARTPMQKNLCTPMFIAALFTEPSVGNSLSAHQ